MTEQIKQQFRDDEVVVLRHWSKEKGEYVTNVFPKIGGRLRLAHEQNDGINIETKIYHYDQSVAVVIATIKNETGQFTGIGMSSVDRDQRIAPAILELAETRAISRALRWAGFGIDACSAEEISNLENGNGSPPGNTKPTDTPDSPKGDNGNSNRRYHSGYSNQNYRGKGGSNGGGNGGANGGNGGNGNGGGRLSPKQYKYLIMLSEEKNISYEALNQKSIDTYGVVLEHLTKACASSMIQELQTL